MAELPSPGPRGGRMKPADLGEEQLEVIAKRGQESDSGRGWPSLPSPVWASSFPQPSNATSQELLGIDRVSQNLCPPSSYPIPELPSLCSVQRCCPAQTSEGTQKRAQEVGQNGQAATGTHTVVFYRRVGEARDGCQGCCLLHVAR